VRLAEPPAITPPEQEASRVEPYDVLLLGGTPRQHTCTLPSDIAAGAQIDLGGEQWTVADVRASETGPTRLICIYAA
jgi:hypothetical protein